MTKSLKRVVFQPAASQGMQRGIHKIVAAVRPTLGPRSRVVALELHTGPDTFEFVADAGIVARRIIQLADRDEDVGAMLVRKAIWRVHDKAGDGAATAAVLFESVYDQGLKYIAAGGNAMQLRRHLERNLQVVLDELAGMTVPISGQDRLAQFAQTICQDAELSELMGEIFDIIGEWGRMEIRAANGRESEREYVEGLYWESPPFAREMLACPHQMRVDLEDAHTLISDLSVEDPQQIVSFLDMIRRAGIRSLLMTAQNLSAAAIGVLLANNNPGKLQIVAAKMPFMVDAKRQAVLGDMALLTGGRPILQASGETLSSVRPEDLGRARKVWADQSYFGIVGGRGNPRALRRHVRELRAAFNRASDSDDRQELRERIGKLMGGSATLWVGGVTEMEIETRKTLAQRTAEALRGAIREGVVPGGGAALLACRPALQARLDNSTDPDERTAYRILLRALEEPARTIIANAGCDPYPALAEINRAGPGYGFEVHSERVVPMAEAGIWDGASVVRTALITAITTAALTLSTEVLIHRKKPVEMVAP